MEGTDKLIFNNHYIYIAMLRLPFSLSCTQRTQVKIADESQAYRTFADLHLVKQLLWLIEYIYLISEWECLGS